MKPWLSTFLALAVVGSLAVVFYPSAPQSKGPILPTDTYQIYEALPEEGLERAIAMDLLAREVGAGQRTLLDAAAHFRELKRVAHKPSGTNHPAGDDLPIVFPGRTVEERLCQQVIARVRLVLRDGPPGAAEAAVARLETELWEELRRHGAIRLAEPSELPPVQELLEQARKAMRDAERQRLLRGEQRDHGFKRESQPCH